MTAMPIVAVAMWISTKGFINEWRSCESFIRPLGHTAILLVFVAAHLMNIKVGSAAVASLSLFASILIDIPEFVMTILVASGIHMATASLNVYDVIALSIAITTSIPENATFLDNIETFAYSGHATVLVSCGVCKQSYAFFLSSLIVTIISLKFSAHKVFAVSLSLSSALHFYSCLRIRDDVPQYWSSRPLWKCQHGYKTTGCLIIYAVALLWHGLLVTCDASYSLHALHVGGIVATCLFIYPQISSSSHIIAKVVMVCAGLSDFAMSILQIVVRIQKLEDTLAYCLLLKSTTSLLTALGLCKVDVLNETRDIQFYEKPSTNVTALRLVSAVIYIAVMLALSIETDDVIEALSHATHYCFIVGALAIEAIVCNDTLSSRITRTLLAFQIIGCLVNVIAFENDESFTMIITTVLFLSMPWYTSSFQGILSFNQRQNNIIETIIKS